MWFSVASDAYWDSKQSTDHSAESKAERTSQYSMVVPQVLNYFQAATICDNSYFKAWHEFAMINFRVVQFKNVSESGTGIGIGIGHPTPAVGIDSSPRFPSADSTANVPPNMNEFKPLDITNHVVPAIQGFTRSILLQKVGENCRPDVLRILALWFEYGTRKDVESALMQCINTISIDIWLAVIPQLIARIHTPQVQIRNLLLDLLCKIGKAHPQSIVWSLITASKSQSEARRQAALNVLNHMHQHSPSLVQQAQVVSTELVRVVTLC